MPKKKKIPEASFIRSLSHLLPRTPLFFSFFFLHSSGFLSFLFSFFILQVFFLSFFFLPSSHLGKPFLFSLFSSFFFFFFSFFLLHIWVTFFFFFFFFLPSSQVCVSELVHLFSLNGITVRFGLVLLNERRFTLSLILKFLGVLVL